MHRFISRQPILDRFEKVYGYEILFRPGEVEIWPPVNGDRAGENPSPGTSAFEGIDEITGGARAFIKCTRQALVGGTPRSCRATRLSWRYLRPGNPMRRLWPPAGD